MACQSITRVPPGKGENAPKTGTLDNNLNKCNTANKRGTGQAQTTRKVSGRSLPSACSPRRALQPPAYAQVQIFQFNRQTRGCVRRDVLPTHTLS